MRPDHEHLRDALASNYLRATEEQLNENRVTDSLHRMLLCIVRSYLDDLSLAASIGERIANLEGQLARIERRAERKGHMTATTMEQAEIETLIDPEFTVLRSRTQGGLVIEDESAVPEAFWKLQRELDRDALLAALRAGEAVPGVLLSASEAAISVRTR